MTKKKNKKRTRIQRVSPKEFVAHAQAKISAPVHRVENMEGIDKFERIANNLITMTLILANVQYTYFQRSITEMAKIGKRHSHGLKMKIRNYIKELEKLKGMSGELASVVQSLHGAEEDSFNRYCDYIEELIPLFIDRVGDDKRTDYVAQCILQAIYTGYTSKLQQFEEYGHKHLTRSKSEASRIRKINAWKRNQRQRREAIVAGRPAPADMPFPFHELDKQMYLDL